MRGRSLIGIAVVIAGLGFGIAGLVAQAREGQPMILPVDPAPLLVETDAGAKPFSVEVADEPAERSAGLMFRQDMAAGRGMLFVFEKEQQVSFWMKNTPMPLDLVFIGGDGRIRDILPGESFSEAPISPGVPVRFVLELKRGTAASQGLDDGDTVRHPLVDAAAAQ